MNKKEIKKLRKLARQTMQADSREVWDSLCTLPLKKRIRLAWMLLTAKKGTVKA